MCRRYLWNQHRGFGSKKSVTETSAGSRGKQCFMESSLKRKRLCTIRFPIAVGGAAADRLAERQALLVVDTR